MTGRVGLLVLGMHRSGTSALTGCLKVLGVPLGEPLLPPNFANEKGYWELAEAVDIHDALLRSFDSSATDLRPLPGGWTEDPAARRARERLADLVTRTFGDEPLWALKDPRLCLLLPLWLPLLAELGIEPRVVLTLRSPWETARSLDARDGLPVPQALALWERHYTEAERETRALRRVVTSYDRLLAGPGAELARIAGGLGVSWPNAIEPLRAELGSFLEPSLRHWSPERSRPDLPADVVQEVEQFAEAFLALIDRDDEPARADLERVGEAARRSLARHLPAPTRRLILALRAGNAESEARLVRLGSWIRATGTHDPRFLLAPGTAAASSCRELGDTLVSAGPPVDARFFEGAVLAIADVDSVPGLPDGLPLIAPLPEPGAHALALIELRSRAAPIHVESRRLALPRVEGPLSDAGFAVEWLRADVPDEIARRANVVVRVTLRNAGPEIWPDVVAAGPESAGANAVRLSYRWRAAGEPPRHEDYRGRVELPRSVEPGESLTVSVPVSAPEDAGALELEIALVQELVAWFESKGTPVLVRPVRIV